MEFSKVDDQTDKTVKLTQHKTLRLDKCTCLYRGKEIELREHISTGYGGRYRVGRHSFTTQKEAKSWVDKLCSDKGIESFMTDEDAKQHKMDYYS